MGLDPIARTDVYRKPGIQCLQVGIILFDKFTAHEFWRQNSDAQCSSSELQRTSFFLKHAEVNTSWMIEDSLPYRAPTLDSDCVQYTIRSSFRLLESLARQLMIHKEPRKLTLERDARIEK